MWMISSSWHSPVGTYINVVLSVESFLKYWRCMCVLYAVWFHDDLTHRYCLKAPQDTWLWSDFAMLLKPKRCRSTILWDPLTFRWTSNRYKQRAADIILITPGTQRGFGLHIGQKFRKRSICGFCVCIQQSLHVCRRYFGCHFLIQSLTVF